MNVLITLWFLLLIMFTSDALALNSGECTFSNEKLSYSGVDLPSSNDIYLDGAILGQLVLSVDYSCKTFHKYNNGVALQVGTIGAGNNFIRYGRYRSNVSGIVLESKLSIIPVATHANEILIYRFYEPTYGLNQTIQGTFSQPLFDVIKIGEINSTTSVKLNLERPFKLAAFVWNTSTNDSYISPNNVLDTDSIPVYNASCSITHPTNVEVPALIPNIRHEVSSYFNVVLNCANKVVMQNNIQLTVNPVNTTGVSLSADKSSLLYDFGGQVVSMNIFNSVGTETPMLFSTMYQFNNSSQTNSFTIPMRAKFILGSTEYGSFSFQTQLSVRYN
ncbi:hypothetical protein ACNO5M_25500 [Vibrio owensii]|uniref:hypothetical protein n=1 Tax=Vibrio owensii TaxID=696485 RepID=UPI003AABBBBC